MKIPGLPSVIPPDVKAVIDRSMSNLEEMLSLLREIRDLLKAQQS